MIINHIEIFQCLDEELDKEQGICFPKETNNK
jgi:hypothetical protein